MSVSASIRKAGNGDSFTKRPRTQIHAGARDASTYVEDTVTEKTVAQFITDDMSPETRHAQPPPPTPPRGRAPGSRGTPSLQAKPSSPASSKMDDEILDRLVKLLSSGCSIQLACTEV
jgi:hypothetical protein